jgi:PAS domain S-box-containing protein
MNSLDKDGQLIGFGRELSDAVVRAAGGTVTHLHSSHWPQVLEWLDTGKADFIHDTGYTKSRDAFLDYSDPIIEMPETIFVRTDQYDIASLDSLQGKTVACVDKHITHLYLKKFPFIRCLVVETPTQGLYELVSNKVDAFVYPRQIALSLAQKLRLKDKVKVTGEPLRTLTWSMVVKEGNRDVLGLLNQGLAKVRASGEYERLYNKWWGEKFFAGYSAQQIHAFMTLVSVVSIVVALLAALFFFNHRLRASKRRLESEISEHKRTEETLEESEKKLQAIINTVQDAIVVAQDDGLVFANRATETLTGYSLKEITGRPFIDLIHPEDRGLVQERYRKRLGGTDFPPVYDFRILTKDKSVKWVQIHAAAFDWENHLATLSVLNDITDRKRTEESLKKAEQEFRGIFEHAPVGIFKSTCEGRYLSVNHIGAEMFGYDSPEEMVQSITDIETQIYVDPADRTKIHEILRKEGRVSNFECDMKHKDGTVLPVLFNGHPVFGEDGEIRFIEGFITDITERKWAEENYRNILLTALDGFWITGLDSRFLEVNDAYCELVGYSRTELLAMHVQDVEALETDRQTHEHIQKVIEQGSDRFESQHRCKDGTIIDVEIGTKYASTPNRQFITFIRDMTERKRMEENLLSSKENAEAANRAKSEFLANMSHELRTPLNGVLGMMQLIQETPLSEEQREYLEVSLNAGRSLIQIINDILDLSKIESGKIQIREEVFEIGGVIYSIQNAFMPQFASKGLSVNYHVDSALPPAVVGDCGRLRQILFNIIGNAIKFTPKGEVNVRVYPKGLGTDPGCFELCFEISDTGIGIPEDKLELIFKPFTQVDGSHTRKFGGTGLGLSIVTRLLDLLGGACQMESKARVGTTFRICIPVKTVEGEYSTERQPTTAITPEETLESIPAQLHILMAEDDLSNQLVAKRMLEKQGYTVTCVATGKEALTALEKATFDLVLMDVQMPEMDGTEATREIRKDVRFTDLPIIALTAHAMSGDRERFLEAGMTDYLSKPIGMEELKKVLARVMGK